MDTEFLTVRLSADDAQVLQRLRRETGLSKTDIVRRGLRALAKYQANSTEGGLFELGIARFGRHGNVRRQSTDIKRIAKTRVVAKRSGR